MLIKQLKHLISFLLIFTAVISKGQHITIMQQNKPTSIRGLCVVNNTVAWISGSKGYVAMTKDGGQTWKWQQVTGYETADFRSIEAFSDREAIIMASGTPAIVLKTVDAGNNWQLVYKNTDSAYFLDAMDFANPKHGFILGDPIQNKFLILESRNGGENWNIYNKSPAALPGEAAFAASSTCLRVLDNGKVIIASGGSVAGINVSTSNGDWRYSQLPLAQGQPAKGAFSVAVKGQNMAAVGGDYQHDRISDSTACYSNNFGKTWYLSKTLPAGFQSCVEYIGKNTLLSTGTSGSNISNDNGLTWSKFDDTSFNVCRCSKNGDLILFAGNAGKIAIYKP